jgi:hypothetical protein
MPALLGVGRSGVERLVVVLDPALGVNAAGLAPAQARGVEAWLAGAAPVEASVPRGYLPDVLTLSAWGVRR